MPTLRAFRSLSVDILVPHSLHESRSSSVVASSLVLLSTMVGGGTLSLPFAISETGLLGGVILQCVSALTAGFSLYVLIASARRTGATTYSSLASDAFGREVSVAVSLLTLALLFMGIIAYMILLRDVIVSMWTLSQILSYENVGIDDFEVDRDWVNSMGNWTMMFFLIIIVFPISLNRSLGGLAFVTPLSLTSVFILLVTVLIRGSVHAYTQWDTLVYLLWPQNSMGILRALPIFTLNYMCHFNALSMHAELVNPTRGRLKQVIAITVVSSTLLYALFGVAGYLWTDDVTPGDILSAFDAKDPLINMGRIGIGVALLCNLPLLVLPMRSIITSLLAGVKSIPPRPTPPTPSLSKSPTTRAATTEKLPVSSAHEFRSYESLEDSKRSVLETYTSDSMGEEEEEEEEDDETDIEIEGLHTTNSQVLHVALTFLIIASTYFVATLFPDVTVVWGICGSSVGILLALTFPTAIYLKLRHYKGGTRMALTGVLLLLSLLLLLMCSWASVHPDL